MEFQVGQQVRVKEAARELYARVPFDAKLTVQRITGGAVCVSVGGRGAQWVKAEHLEPVDNGS